MRGPPRLAPAATPTLGHRSVGERIQVDPDEDGTPVEEVVDRLGHLRCIVIAGVSSAIVSRAEERELARQPRFLGGIHRPGELRVRERRAPRKSPTKPKILERAERRHRCGGLRGDVAVSERLITKHSCASAVPEIIVAANVPTIERANARRISTSFRHLAGLAKDSQRAGVRRSLRTT